MRKFFKQRLKVLLFSLSIPTAIFLAVDQSKNVIDSRSVLVFVLTALIIFFSQTFALLNHENHDLDIDEDNKELNFYNIYNHYILPISTIFSLFLLGSTVNNTIFVSALIFFAVFLYYFFKYLKTISKQPLNKELFRTHSLYDLNQLFIIFVIISIILNSVAADPYGSALTIFILFFPLFIISFATILKTTQDKKALIVAIVIPIVVTFLLSIFNGLKLLNEFRIIDSIFTTLLFFLLLRSAEDFFMKSLDRSAIIYRVASIAILIVGIVI